MSQQRPAGSGYQTPVRGSHVSGTQSQSQPQQSQTQGRQTTPGRQATQTTQARQAETSRPAETTQYRRTEPEYRRTEPPRPRRPWWHHALLALLGLIALGGILGAVFGTMGSTTHHRTVPRVPRPTVPALAPVGTSFLTRDAAGNTYDVKLDRIIDPATGVGYSPAAGNRLVGAVYTITGVSGSPVGENVVTSASLLGTNGHIYRATGAPISGYGNFNNSNISVAKGASTTGAAAYQIPTGVKLSQAQWAAAAGHGTISRWRA